MAHSKEEAARLAEQYQELKGKSLPDNGGTITDVAVFPASANAAARAAFIKELKERGTTTAATNASTEKDYDVWVISRNDGGDDLAHYPLEQYLQYLAI